MKLIEQNYDVFLTTNAPGLPLEFTASADEFPGITATGITPAGTAAALASTVSLHLAGSGATTLPPPIDHDLAVLEARKVGGEGYGRRMLTVKLQVPE